MIAKEWIDVLPRNLLVPWYLMASYLYYHCDESAMEDGAYDQCCVRLNREWFYVKHRHKGIVRRSYLTQTTGYNIKRREYPTLVQVAAHSFLEAVRDGTIYESLQSILAGRGPIPRGGPSDAHATVVRRRTVTADGAWGQVGATVRAAPRIGGARPRPVAQPSTAGSDASVGVGVVVARRKPATHVTPAAGSTAPRNPAVVRRTRPVRQGTADMFDGGDDTQATGPVLGVVPILRRRRYRT